MVTATSLLSKPSAARAAGTGTPFEIGAYWQPPVFIGGDFNTNANWATLANSGIQSITATRVPAGTTLNKAGNESGIANSYANGVKLLATDTGFLSKPVYTAADKSAAQSIVAGYAADARVAGLKLWDEPSSYQMEGVGNAYRVAKATAPNLDIWVNHLGGGSTSTSGPPGKLLLSNSGAQGDGSYVAPLNPLGQTIKIPVGTSFLQGVDLFLDSTQWSSSESLTLKLWNSPAKSTLIASNTLNGPTSATSATNYPYFVLNAPVAGGGNYYLELVHNGGGDNSVGWVVHSQSSVYADGTAYENGVAKNNDFFFRLYTTRDNFGTNYQNFLDDWFQYSGADYVNYDSYPFYTNSDNSSYFSIAADIRDRALAHNARYGGYLQSVSISGAFRNPTMDMKRWNAYTYLTYGFTKLQWFTYWHPDASAGESFADAPVSATGAIQPAYAQIQTLNAEMKNLGATLGSLTSRGVYHSGVLPAGTKPFPDDFFVKPTDLSNPLLAGYFTDSSGRIYVMLTNRKYDAAQTVNFQFAPRPDSLTEVSKSTGLGVSVPGYNQASGVLGITLQPGEGRLFALPPSYRLPDLAATATVIASSSYESTTDGWGTNKVNDLFRKSTPGAQGWSSASNLGTNHTESLTFDLGSSKQVGEVDLFPRNAVGYEGAAFPIDYSVQTATSSNGPWTTVASRSNTPAPGVKVQSLTFAPQAAQFVRVVGTNLRTVDAGGDYRMQFAEVEMYASADYAKTATVTASSTLTNYGFTLGAVNDGTRNSVPGARGWTSDLTPTVSHTESLTFDLLANTSISSVDLYPRNDVVGAIVGGFPVDFTIQVATNPSGPWTAVVSQSNYPLPANTVQHFAFGTQTARYVQIIGTKLRPVDGEYRMQFAEVEIG